MELKRNTVGQLSFWTSVLILQIHVLHVFVVFPTPNIFRQKKNGTIWISGFTHLSYVLIVLFFFISNCGYLLYKGKYGGMKRFFYTVPEGVALFI